MASTLRHLTPSDYVTTRWSGGATTQLAIFPPAAVYGDRTFLWRISSATVELPASEFTALPDYERFLSTLRGDIRISHDGGAPISLSPGSIHRFDGGAATRSQGLCTDFNLMLRKGACTGQMRTLRLAENGSARLARTMDPPAGGVHTLVLYCAEGDGAVESDSGAAALLAGEAALVENGEPLLRCRAASAFYLCELVHG